jgi:hypothetical protein
VRGHDKTLTLANRLEDLVEHGLVASR